MNNIVSLTAQGIYSLRVQAEKCIGSAEICDVLEKGEDTFGIVQTLFTFIGAMIVIFTVWRVVKSLIVAKFPEAAKNFAGGLVAAVLCFNIQLPIRLVGAMGNVFEKVFDTLSSLLGG